MEVRTEFSLEERATNEGWLSEGFPTEEGVDSMSLEKDWDPFLEYFLLKMTFSLVSFFLDVSFLGTKISVGVNKPIYFDEDWILQRGRLNNLNLDDEL